MKRNLSTTTRPGRYLTLAACLGLMLLTKAMDGIPREKTAIRPGVMVELEDPTLPVVMLIGTTGAGKSTFGNMLVRLNDPKHPHVFHQSGIAKSKTKEPKTHVIDFDAPLFGEFGNKQLAVIDTPGFDDTDGQSDKIRHFSVAYIQRYKDLYKEQFGVNSFVIVFDWNKVRLNAQIREMVEYLLEMWSEKFLDNVVIVVTNWPYTRQKIRTTQAQQQGRLLAETKASVKKSIECQMYDFIVDYRKETFKDGWSPIAEEQVEKFNPEGANALGDKIFFIDSLYDVQSSFTPENKASVRGEVMRLLHDLNKPKYPCDPAYMNLDVQNKLVQAQNEVELLKGQSAELTKKKEEVLNLLEKTMAEAEANRATERKLFQEALENQQLDAADRLKLEIKEKEKIEEHTKNMRKLNEEKDKTIRELNAKVQVNKKRLDSETKKLEAIEKHIAATKTKWSGVLAKVGAALMAVSAAVQVIPGVGQAVGGLTTVVGGVLVVTSLIGEACGE